MNAPLTVGPGLREGNNYPSPVTRVLVLGYYDGPTEGVLQVGPSGEVYRFAMIEEIPGQGKNDTDLRSFALSPLPPDSLEAIAATLSPFIAPQWPLWVPVWHFPSPESQRDVEGRVDRVLELAGPVAWQVTTDDLFGMLRSAKRLTPGPETRAGN
jgi:hypothetical protein